MTQSNNISLCICTYNQCQQLAKTLDSLLANQQEFIDGDEILIVDNNSSDETKNLIAEYEVELPISYYFEATQGLSVARNKALAEFKNETIIFIDDDITLTKNFIKEYRNAFSQYSHMGFFGGKIHIDWGGKPPSWYKSTDLPLINGLLVYYDQGDENSEFTEESLLPYGANFALRRSLIDQVGIFNLDLGVKGKLLGRGEETDYFKRALLLNLEGIYIANAKVFHRYRIERLSLIYLYRYGIQKGVAAVKLDGAESHSLYSKMAYQLFAGIYQLLKFRRDRFYQCIINIGLLRGIHIISRSNNDTAGE